LITIIVVRRDLNDFLVVRLLLLATFIVVVVFFQLSFSKV
jgi:hypothetical protein